MDSQLLVNLIRKLQKKDLDEHPRKLVFDKLFKMIYPTIYGFSISKCARSPDTRSIDDMKDLMQETAIKILFRLDSFKINEDQTDEQSKVQFISWVLMIVNNTWLDRLREIKNKGAERFDMDKEWRYVYYPFDEREVSDDLKELIKILEKLPTFKRDILLTCANFKGGTIPSDILEDLSKSVKKTKVNIRQINKREKDRIKKRLT